MHQRRPSEASTIDGKHAREQLVLFLTQARPEKVSAVTVETLLQRFKVSRRVAVEELARVQGRANGG